MGNNQQGKENPYVPEIEEALKNKKMKTPRRLLHAFPPSPCSVGCLPCNIYCFGEVMKRTAELRKQLAVSNIRRY